MYERMNESLPNYLDEHLVLNNKRHSRNTRYSSINTVCPKYKRETEGGSGRSFAVSATRLWNSIYLRDLVKQEHHFTSDLPEWLFNG